MCVFNKGLLRNMLAQNGKKKLSLNKQELCLSWGLKQMFKIPPGFKTYLFEFCGYGRWQSSQGSALATRVWGHETQTCWELLHVALWEPPSPHRAPLGA